MSMLDKLMKADARKVAEKPETSIEIPRLSKAIGDTFTVKVRAITMKRMTDIEEMNTEYKKDGSVKHQDKAAIAEDIIIASAVDPNFKDKGLMDKFNVKTPNDLLNTILLPGEVLKLSEAISKICGVGKDTMTMDEVDEAVKN